MIEFTIIDENGDESAYELPSKREVCNRCEGYGTHLNPSIGEHAYSAEEFCEAFSEPEDREEYFRRGGIYDVQCERCKGERVIDVIDRKTCLSSEQKATLALYDQKLKDDYAYERECAAERRYGC